MTAGEVPVEGKIDLLVTSADSYLDVALLNLQRLQQLGFTQYFSLHLSVGESNPVIAGVSVIRCVPPRSWSADLRLALEQLRGEYVLLWIDDCLPTGEVPPGQLRSAIDKMIARDANYFRVNPLARGSLPSGVPAVTEIRPGELYRASTVISLWRRGVLLSLLRDNENAWQFETIGSDRSDAIGGFYVSDVWLVPYVNLVVKGLVDPRAECRARKAGMDTAGISRRRMSAGELAALRLRDLRSATLRLMPWSWRRAIRQFLIGGR